MISAVAFHAFLVFVLNQLPFRVTSAKEKIRKIDYENKKNTVTITGPFDPQHLSQKLRCKACDVIKGIEIVKEKPEDPKKKTEDPNKEVKKEEAKKAPPPSPAPTGHQQHPPCWRGAAPKWPPCGGASFCGGCGSCPGAGGNMQVCPVVPRPCTEKVKPKEETKAPPPSSSTTTTVNLQFGNMCVICYPWPCKDPTHSVVQPKTKPPPCEEMVGYQKCPPCGGPWYCGGCVWCCGANGIPGWLVPPPICCPGPSVCRGCNGCRIVHESKFTYEEYPSGWCTIM
jgi:hypothetical protein